MPLSVHRSGRGRNLGRATGRRVSARSLGNNRVAQRSVQAFRSPSGVSRFRLPARWGEEI